MDTTLGILMEGLIDYAGLYPPASLSMAAAVRNYGAYLQGTDSGWLGRFVLPAARLDEFAQCRAGEGAGSWRLAALIGTDPTADLEGVIGFNRQARNAVMPAALIDTLEIKADRPSDIARFLAQAPSDVTVYFEIPLTAPGPCLAELAANGGRAKLRTGGVTPDRIPSASDVAGFLTACVQARVPFKATAGLHHPLRSLRPLTYAPDSPKAMMHGFLNVFLAAAYAAEGAPAAELAALLEETDLAAIRFSDGSAQWRNRRIGSDRLREARKRSAVSFGSCSFEEPRDDLAAAGLL